MSPDPAPPAGLNEGTSRSPRERYTPGHAAGLIGDVLGKRSLRREAAFVLPYLRKGWTVLDCGCGPGSISVELAAEVRPGRVVGIDIHEDQFALGRALARERGYDNVHFQNASVYELPFADESFDVVLAHGLLYHLARPEDALREMRRVMRPAGIAALRDYDSAGNIVAPEWPMATRSDELFEKVLRHAGGDPRFGRRHGALLRRLGFDVVGRNASFDVYQTAEEIAAVATTGVEFWKSQENRAIVRNEGWATTEELDAIVEATRAWAAQPHAFFARSRCETVAVKRSNA